MICPILDLGLVQKGNISLLGLEVDEISEKSVDFGMFILLGIKKVSQKTFNELIHFNFLSNGIEGFLIRSIPRKFWCRLSKELVKKKFSFELFSKIAVF